MNSLLKVMTLRCEYAENPLGVETQEPRFSWRVEGKGRGIRQTAYQILVASDPKDLAAGTADLWDSGKVSSDQSVFIPYAGAPLHSGQRCFWQVRIWDGHDQVTEYSASAWWEMGLLSGEDWQAQWISRPDICMLNPGDAMLPSPIFRKVIALGKPIARATLFISGLGFMECHLNGQRVGNHVLDPVVTRYDRRAQYVSYDITHLLTSGPNVLGVILGNGWYNCQTNVVWDLEKAAWRDYPKLLLQAQILFTDGTTETIVSDTSWKVSEGPIVFDALRNGETYDARRERDGWLEPGYDDRDWMSVKIVSSPGGIISSQQQPPCKVMQTLAPMAITEVTPGVFVYDLGQNIAGWAQLTVSGPAGTEVTLRYAEKVSANGDIDPANINMFCKTGDFQTDRFILKGVGTEVWEPRFTYHGFRYVQMTGFPGTPTLDNLRGRVVHTAFEDAGSFACSNVLLNRIQECTRWSYRGNFVGIPTDCPQREKNGWTGDAQLVAETGLFNFTPAAAYSQWITDFADEQRPSGQLPGIIPTAGWGYNWGSGPAWDSAYLLIPWYIYQYCGDTRILSDHYDGMKRYVDFMTSMSTDHLVTFGLGDWCAVAKERMPSTKLTSSGYYYTDCRILAAVARLLGKQEDADSYAALADQIRLAINEACYDPATGCYDNGGQTAQGCALFQGFVADDAREQVLARLVRAVEERDGHPDFGILGSKYVLNALTECGRADLAYTIVTQTGFPSWGYWLAHGATTLWEDWQGNASLNHIMFGDISAWMFKTLAGIAPNPAHPGFKQFMIHPHILGDLTWVRAEHTTMYGTIRCAWKLTDEQFTLHLTVPGNCQAQVSLPVAVPEAVCEGGRPIADAEGVQSVGMDGNTAVYLVYAGDYVFSAARGSLVR